MRLLCIFFPEISIYIYKRYFDKTKCMYFLRKDERIFDKYLGKKKFYLKIWEKVSNIIKKV